MTREDQAISILIRIDRRFEGSILKLLSRLAKAFRNFVTPPTWESLTDEQRQQLLSLSRSQRRKLAKAMAQGTVIDNRALQMGGGHADALDTSGAEGADSGGAMGNILGDWRREQIKEAMREGERHDR